MKPMFLTVAFALATLTGCCHGHKAPPVCPKQQHAQKCHGKVKCHKQEKKACKKAAAKKQCPKAAKAETKAQ